MIPIQPDSQSFILRATHILSVRADSVTVGAWTPSTEGGEVRDVTLGLHLDQVLKGHLVEAPGTSFTVVVHQHGTETGRIAGVPGIWSHVEIEQGKALVVFSRGGAEKAAEVINDPLCFSVLAVEEALVDVELASEGAKKEWSVVELAQHAIPKASRLGFLFSEYLVARWGMMALDDPKIEESMLKLLVLPSFEGRARATLLHELSALAALYSGKPLFVARLARALFDLLGVKEAGVMRDRVVQTQLPGLLGLQGRMPRLSAEVVFYDAPHRRAAAQAQMGSFSGPAAKLLSEWLRE